MKQRTEARGLGVFLTVWSGQFVSTIGTLMTSLALAFWAFDITGRATELGLMVFFTFGPRILLGPFAGALVDRWRRRTILITCDLLAGLGSIAILLLFANNRLEIWHICILTFLMSAFIAFTAFTAFQGPGFIASATMMAEKRHHGRVNGLRALNANASAIIAPTLAGLLLLFIGLKGILVVDVVTFLFAATTLIAVRIPEPTRTATPPSLGPTRRFLNDINEGLRFLRGVKALVGLQLVFASANLFGTSYDVLFRPFVLLRTRGGETAVAFVQSAIGIGGAAAAFILALWGGPKRHRTMFAMMLFSIAFVLRGIVGLHVSVLLLAGASLTQSAFLTFAASSARTIWQAKVPPALLGRVFSTLGSISGMLMMVTMLSAGPFADYYFEPAIRDGESWLACVFGRLVGTGAGSGIGLLVMSGGLIAAAICIGAMLFKSLRQIETTITDCVR
ncbi:MFS transporter [Candidatus Bipolaricaulota bacterium]|nr:MFS transporter [Candidatus Bipolaricaulota bacterium]